MIRSRLLLGLMFALAQVLVPLRITVASNVLSQADITYLGAIRMPTSGANTAFTSGGLTGRIISGHTHIYLWTDNQPDVTGTPYLADLDITGLTPDTNYTTAPRAVLNANCGDIMHSKRNSWWPRTTLSGGINNSQTTLSLASYASMSNGYVVTIDSEDIRLDAIGSPSTVTRGVNSTTPASHSNGANAWANQQLQLGQGAAQVDLHWNDSTQLMYWTYLIAYTDPNPYVMGASSFAGGTDCTSTTAYGPWWVNSTDKESNVWEGWRSYIMVEHPTTGKMLLGGVPKGGEANLSQGPSLFGDADWPTTSTTGGFGMTPISQANEYLNYYRVANPVDAVTGAPIGTLKAMQWNPTVLGAYYNFELAPASQISSANPANNGGLASWGDTSFGLTGVAWFEGAHKRGVIFDARMPVSTVDTLDCTTGAHEWYANIGNGHFTVTSLSGVFNDNDQILGLTSGKGAHIQGGGSGAYPPYISWQQASSDCGGGGCSDTYNFTVGETIQDQSNGHTAVIATQRRYNKCNHGCSPANQATGPSSTLNSPMFLIYNPDKLINVKAGSETDYEQAPDSMILIEGAYGVHVAPEGNGSGVAKTIDGIWIDTTTNNFYILSRGSDWTSPYSQGFPADLIHVFHINDAATPQPSLLDWLWSLTPSLTQGHAKPRSLLERPR